MKSTLLAVAFAAALTVCPLAAADFNMPFGIAVAPGARLVIGDVFDSPSGDREEAIARFATKDSRQYVIAFYRKALEEAGFLINAAVDEATRTSLSAKRDDDRINVYYKETSDWVEAGESEISINARYTK